METEPNKKAECLVLDFYHSLEHTISDSYSKFTWQICCKRFAKWSYQKA